MKAHFRKMFVVYCYFLKWGAVSAIPVQSLYCQVIVFDENQESQYFTMLQALVEVIFLSRSMTWLIVMFVCLICQDVFELRSRNIETSGSSLIKNQSIIQLVLLFWSLIKAWLIVFVNQYPT